MRVMGLVKDRHEPSEIVDPEQAWLPKSLGVVGLLFGAAFAATFIKFVKRRDNPVPQAFARPAVDRRRKS